MADMTSELGQLGSLPITPDTPCGVAARYEPEYESLGAEIAKQESLHPQPVNWENVVDLATRILRDTSKDLLVASYLSCGLFERQDYRGLEIALTIYGDLIHTFWDGLFPEKKRKQGRINAITWFIERLGNAITRRPPAPSDRAVVVHCEELAQHLKTAVEDVLGDDAPDFGALTRPLREALAGLPAEAKEEETATSQEAPQTPSTESEPVEPATVAPVIDQTPASPSTPSEQETTPEVSPPVDESPPPPPVTLSTAPAAITTFENENDAQRAIRTCQTTLRNAASFLLHKSLENPLPYRLSRIGVWLLVVQAPLSQDGTTQLPSVQPATLQQCEESLKHDRFTEVVLTVEGAFGSAPFWLDAHRFTARALEGLGPSHHEAKRAVIEEVASFIRRVPGLLELCFADGTPFADDETRAWIASEVTSQAGGAAPKQVFSMPQLSVANGQALPLIAPADETGVAAASQEAADEARRLAQDGNLLEAMALFRDGAQRAASLRERFLWHVQQARFCAELGFDDVAVSQLEFLDEQVKRFGLEEWEPSLSLPVVQLLLQGYARLAQKDQDAAPEFAAKAKQLHSRLCRLDVGVALAFTQQ